MGKSKQGEKEYTRLQRALYENQKLKREIASLRKQLARLDLDRHTYVKDIIEKSDQLEKALDGKELLQKLKKEWSCKSCSRGHLEVFLYNRPDGTFYYRRCSNPECGHRTLAQRYEPGKVKGVLQNGEILD